MKNSFVNNIVGSVHSSVSKVCRSMGTMLLAGALLCAMAVPAFADTGEFTTNPGHSSYSATQPTTTITVNGVADGFKAYRVMDLTTRLKPDCTTSHAGAPEAHTEDCYAYAYTVNTTYAAALKNAFTALDDGGHTYDTNSDGEYSLSEIVHGLEKLPDDDAQLREFADLMYAELTGKAADATATEAPDNTWTFANVPQGYYIILEDAPTGTQTDHVSKAVLNTAGQIKLTVKAKDGTTTFTKEVYENTPDAHTNGSVMWTEGWGAAADYGLGDEVPFRLTATLGENLTQFDTYKLVFHDTLAKGLTLTPSEKTALTVTLYNADNTPHVLTVNDDYTVETDTSTGDACNLHITLNNLRDLSTDAENGCKVVVDYKATLTGDDVVYGNDGNDNTAHVEYSSNPYVDSQTQTTPDSTVTVFTYILEVTKQDDKAHALDGAGFTLYMLDQDTAKGLAGAKWAEQSSWVQVKEGSWELTSKAGDKNSVFTFRGLETGIYKLVESQVPDGYYPAEDLYFRIDSELKTDGSGEHTIENLKALNQDSSDETALTVSKEKATAKAGMSEASTGTANFTTTIENVEGAKLPSTGGAGVYAIYAGGAAAIAACCVLLMVLKKRDREA